MAKYAVRGLPLQFDEKNFEILIYQFEIDKLDFFYKISTQNLLGDPVITC